MSSVAVNTLSKGEMKLLLDFFGKDKLEELPDRFECHIYVTKRELQELKCRFGNMDPEALPDVFDLYDFPN